MAQDGLAALAQSAFFWGRFSYSRLQPDTGRHNILVTVSSQVLRVILVHNMTRLTAEKALVCFHHTIMILICGGGGNVVNAMVFSDRSLNGALFNLLSKMQVSKFTRISK